MTVSFYQPNADTGAADSASIQPVQNKEAVDETVTNRAPENLRVRTEVLKTALESQALLAAAPILAIPEATVGGAAVDVRWDGPFVPGAALADIGQLGSGAFYLEQAVGGDFQLKFYLANSAPVVSYARASVYVDLTPVLVFTTTATAAKGANALRVRVNPTLPSYSTSPVEASWVDPSASVGTVAAPLPATLQILIRANGTTTVADVQAALTALTHASGFSVTVTSPSSATTLALADSGYVNFSGGVDRAVWTLSKDQLTGFFDSGTVTTQLAHYVPPSPSAQWVKLSTLSPYVVPGSVLHVGTGGSHEDVTVVAIDAVNSLVQAVFTLAHVETSAVVCAPNRMRSGDTLLLSLGNGRDRLARSAPGATKVLTKDDLRIPRLGGFDQDTPMVVIASCPESSSRLIFGAQTIDQGGSLMGSASDSVRLAGDLAGPGSRPEVPTVVWATSSRAGVVTLNATPPDVPMAAMVTPTGMVSGKGLTSPVGATTLQIGTGANDAVVSIGKPAGVVSIEGPLGITHGAEVDGAVSVNGTMQFNAPPVFGTDVNVPTKFVFSDDVSAAKSMKMTGVGTQQIGKAVGDLEIGATGDNVSVGAFYIVTRNTRRWKVDATGNLLPASVGPTLTNLPTPVNATDAASKSYVDGLPTRVNTFTAAQTFNGTTIVPAPSADTHAAQRKTVTDATAALTAGINTWAAKQTFTTVPQSAQDPAANNDLVRLSYYNGKSPGKVAVGAMVTWDTTTYLINAGDSFGPTISVTYVATSRAQCSWTTPTGYTKLPIVTASPFSSALNGNGWNHTAVVVNSLSQAAGTTTVVFTLTDSSGNTYNNSTFFFTAVYYA